MIFSICSIVLSGYRVYKGYLYYIPSLLIGLYCLSVVFAALDILNYGFAGFWSNNGVVVFSNEIAIYSLFILSFYIFSTIGLEAVLGINKINIELKGIQFNVSRVNKVILLISFFIFIYFLIHFFSLNLSTIWKDDSYILGNRALKFENSFFIIVNKISGVISILAMLLISISYLLKNNKAFYLLLVPFSFYLLLKIGFHSRSAALYLGVMAGLLMLSSKKNDKYIFSPFLFLLSFFVLINSLVGRNTNIHGISSLAYLLENVYVGINNGILNDVLANIFEGSFVLGDTFFYLYHSYPEIYKVLSISPFPSFIDGFSHKALSYEFRLHAFVPMSALGELLIFGYFYIFAYFTIIFFALYFCIKSAQKKKTLLFFVVLTLISLASYLQFAYPVRNVMRFFYIAIFLCLIFIYIPKFRWGK